MLTYGKVNYTLYERAKQSKLSPDEVSQLVLANYRVTVRAGWDGKDAELIAIAHVMAVLHGALDVGGEWSIVPDENTSDIKAAEWAYLMGFEKNSASGSLICTMGAINHNTINHTTSQSKVALLKPVL